MWAAHDSRMQQQPGHLERIEIDKTVNLLEGIDLIYRILLELISV